MTGVRNLSHPNLRACHFRADELVVDEVIIPALEMIVPAALPAQSIGRVKSTAIVELRAEPQLTTALKWKFSPNLLLATQIRTRHHGACLSQTHLLSNKLCEILDSL